eukprot:maker-scaffold_24-snap-gene-2.5-mRNA-1 protein AED:0.02 eAED:0.02 QI:57/1/1/1/1/1/3/101/511
MGNSNSYNTLVEGHEHIQPIKISHKSVHKKLFKAREKKTNKLPQQGFSYSGVDEEFSIFTEHRAQMDYCVLGGRAKASQMTGHFLKKTCQDNSNVIKLNSTDFAIGVFDGHGPHGEKISDICAFLFPSILKKNPNLESNPCLALEETILTLHRSILKTSEFGTKVSGSTATIILLRYDEKSSKPEIFLAWVGDSKAVLLVTENENFSSFKAFDITTEHNFKENNEIKRIESRGGIVSRTQPDPKPKKGKVLKRASSKYSESHLDPLRVWSLNERMSPGLAMSKSIGDAYAHIVGCNAYADSLEINLEKIISFPEKLSSILTQRRNQLGQENFDEKKEENKEVMILENSRISTNSTSKGKEESGKLRKSSKKSLSAIEGISKQNTNRVKSKVFKTLKDLKTTISSQKVDDNSIKHCILLVASDGVWNAMSNQYLGQYISLLLRQEHKSLHPESPKKLEKARQALGKLFSPSKKHHLNISERVCLEAQQKYFKSFTNNAVKTDDISAVSVFLF